MKQTSSSFKKKIFNKKGVTLVELSIFLIVIPILIFLVSGFFSTVFTSYQMVRNNHKNLTTASLLLDNIRLDIEDAYLVEEKDEVLIISTEKGRHVYEIKDGFFYRDNTKLVSLSEIRVSFEDVSLLMEEEKGAKLIKVTISYEKQIDLKTRKEISFEQLISTKESLFHP